MNHSAAWWSERVAELSAGRSVGDVARRHAVRENTLLWWRGELQRRARKAQGTQRLLPIAISQSSSIVADTASRDIEVAIETKRGSLRLRGNIDLAQLAALIAAVRA
jgi:transposase-like protein